MLFRSDQVSSLAQDHAIFGGCTGVTAPVNACRTPPGPPARSPRRSSSWPARKAPTASSRGSARPCDRRLGTCEIALLFEQHAQMSRGSRMSPLVRPTMGASAATRSPVCRTTGRDRLLRGFAARVGASLRGRPACRRKARFLTCSSVVATVGAELRGDHCRNGCRVRPGYRRRSRKRTVSRRPTGRSAPRNRRQPHGSRR